MTPLKKKAKSPKEIKKVIEHKLIYNPEKHSYKVMFGIPTTGIIRFEWHMAFSQLVIPINWSHGAHYVISPINYQVAEARNECVKEALNKGFDWIIFIDHDTILPHDTCVKIRHHMSLGKYPVIGGLYYVKSSVPEPLLFRGRGNGAFYGWEQGDIVEVDGLPLGCTLINTGLFRSMTPPWFVTPTEFKIDENGIPSKVSGTEDLTFFDRVINEGILEKAGWPELADKKYPFICDTSIFCQHIDLSTGKQYPRDCDNQWKLNHKWALENYKKENKNGSKRTSRNRNV
jgi:hypothetical protein